MDSNNVGRWNSALGKTIFNLLIIVPLVLLVQVPIFLAGAAVGTYFYYAPGLPKIPELKQYQPRTVSTFYSDDGTVIGIFYKQKRFVKELSQIPDHVIKTFLAGEDQRFFEHGGVDWQSMGRAIILNIMEGRIRSGGSTITMQVTRNFYLTRQKRISRKLREIILAGRLEEAWGKEKILYVYLNEIYLGEGCYGIEAAARNYFDKPVEHLTVAEAALIAGLVASPAKYNPFKSEKKARQRQITVLNRMVKFGFLAEQEYKNAINQPLQFRKEIPHPFDLVPDFTEVVRRYIVDKYGRDRLYNQGLKVFTTCKIDYQKDAVEAVKKGLSEIKSRHKNYSIMRKIDAAAIPEYLENRSTSELKYGKLYKGVVTQIGKTDDHTVLFLSFSPDLHGRVKLDGRRNEFKIGHIVTARFDKLMKQIPYFTIDEAPQLQAALVCIENRTGYVRALVGGSTGERFKFNRAVQAKRQPGSAFKPIIYATAIEKKSYSPATVVIDEWIEVEIGGKNEIWNPKNAGGKFYGPLSLRRALELSRNICTIKILMDVHPQPVLKIAHDMGIKSPLGEQLSLSLGTSEVTLFELTSAYTTFPNSGVHVQPVLIKRIEDRFGNVLEDNTNIPILNQNQIPAPIHRREFRPVSDNPQAAPEEGVIKEEVTISEEDEDSDSHQYQEDEEVEQTSASTEGDKEFDTHSSNTTTEQKDSIPKQREVKAAMSPQTAYIMTDLLLGGVRAGTGANMKKYLKRRDIAGKTGTTNNAEDLWFIGFNPDYTAGVWVGFDEKRSLGAREGGGRAALPIWGHFMKEILKGVPQKSFPVPPEITFTEMTTYTGNMHKGFRPSIVREPVYSPFVGRTLVLCPLDTPDRLRHYTMPGYEEPVQAGQGVIPNLSQQQYQEGYQSTRFQPVMPANPAQSSRTWNQPPAVQSTPASPSNSTPIRRPNQVVVEERYEFDTPSPQLQKPTAPGGLQLKPYNPQSINSGGN